MKRLINLALMLIMSVSIMACTSKQSNTTKSEVESSSSTTIDKNDTSQNNNDLKNTLTSYQEQDKLPKKYSPELAQKNGDVVSVHGTSYNIEKLDNFLERIKNKKTASPDMVRITTYTIEGDAIICDLIANNEGMKVVEDSSRDNFGSAESKMKREFKVLDIVKQYKDESIIYTAKLEQSAEFPLIVVNNKKKI